MEALEKAQGLILPRARTGDFLAGLGTPLLRGLGVYCIDAGNVFDPLPLAAWLRAIGEDPRALFERQIFISRAFTCFQLAGAVETLLGPLVDVPSPVLALILGLEEMFLDEDIRLKERRYCFDRVLMLVDRFTSAGLPILLTCGQSAPANDWIARLRPRVNMLASIQTALPEIRSRLDGSHLAHVQ